MPSAPPIDIAINVRLEMPDRATHLTGFRHFWLKRVVGFYPGQHCAGCLKGSYVEGVVGVDMPAAIDLQFGAAAGELFYLCGVASPYQWARNAHLAFRAMPGSLARLTLFNGGLVTVANAAPVLFTDAQALEFYPGKGTAFLTCRNFQFGAALHHGALL
jgi:hypothetical protein